jgi:hypothetical protein
MRADGAPAGPPVEIRICDISSRGLMAQASEPPERGASVEIVAAHRTIAGQVVWRKRSCFGLHTKDQLDVPAILSRISPAESLHRASADGTVPPEPSAARPAAALNHALGAAMQIAVIGLFAAMLVAALASTFYQFLSRPLSWIVVPM